MSKVTTKQKYLNQLILFEHMIVALKNYSFVCTEGKKYDILTKFFSLCSLFINL